MIFYLLSNRICLKDVSNPNSVRGNSIVIRKGVNAKIISEKQIFSKSKIQFLISIGEKNDEKGENLELILTNA